MGTLEQDIVTLRAQVASLKVVSHSDDGLDSIGLIALIIAALAIIVSCFLPFVLIHSSTTAPEGQAPVQFGKPNDSLDATV